jgi:hypothetical protein
MTAMGQFRWGDEDITHEGVQRALRRGLDLTEGGEPIVRLGHQWCYLTLEDTLYRVNAIHVDGDALAARLDDGRTLELDPTTLWEEPGHGLRATVPTAPTSRPASARFTNRAQLELAELLESDCDPPTLILGGRSVPIPSSPPTKDAS